MVLTDERAQRVTPEEETCKRGAESHLKQKARSGRGQRSAAARDSGADSSICLHGLPINNILRRSPKQATGMKYLLAKCNNWQREPKPVFSPARPLAR